ncbi:hypothetical protein BJ944DRAFT_227857 [Cunninghamella echinulata]|nr:hypothetical protein BJ944DRAFT_227857 [Cunninghamella echinulata]
MVWVIIFFLFVFKKTMMMVILKHSKGKQKIYIRKKKKIVFINVYAIFYYWEINIRSSKVVDASGDSNEPGDAIILWERKQTNFDNQLWKYEEGYIINKASGLALELPGYQHGGNITPGTSLIQASRRERPESINQLWAYNHQMIIPYDPKVRLTAQNDNFMNGERVVVEGCIFEDPAFQWIFDSV